MIVSFRSKALERFWWKNDVRRVDSQHLSRLTLVLSTLDVATTPQGMNVAGWRFHALQGDQAGRFSVRVNANWRVTFGWSADGPDAVEVDYEDYH